MRERWARDILAVQCGELLLDLVHRRATLADAPMQLPPRIFDLLAFFLAAPDQLHSREAVLADVWEGLVVEEGSLGQAVWLLRKALGPERRDSLQSVPKRGYVFHPWAPVSLVSSELDTQTADPVPEPSSEAPPAEPPRAPREAVTGEPVPSAPAAATVLPQSSVRSSSTGRIAAALLVGCTLLVLALVSAFRTPSADSAHRTIVLLVKPMPEGAVRERQLALVLEDWLQYRLAGSARTLVLTDEDLDEEDAYRPTLTLMLSAVPVGADSAQSKLRVDLLGQPTATGLERMEGQIRHARIDEDLDRFAAELLGRLQAAPSDQPGAGFAIGKAFTAYAAALDAARRGRHEDALKQLEAALVDAPEFAPLRLRLARALSAQGETMSANEHYRTARALDPSWGQSSPYTLELESAHANTFADTRRVAERYLELYRAHPQRLDLLLDAVEAEDSPVERLRLLEQAEWADQPSAIRRRAKLRECGALMSLGRPPEAEACAASVAQGLTTATHGSALRQLGVAKAIVANARYNQGIESPDLREFRQSAEAFRRGGNGLDALRIEATTEMLHGHPGRDVLPRLDQFQALVTRNQLRLAEFDLYRNLAIRLIYLDDPQRSLGYLQKARRVAMVYGGRREMAWASLSLGGEHFQRGEIAQAEEVLAGLDALDLDLDTRSTVAARRVGVLQLQGRHAEAAQLVERMWSSALREGAEPMSDESRALLRLSRVAIALQRGDLKTIGPDLDALKSEAPPDLAQYGYLLEANARFLGGDSGGSIELVQAELEKHAAGGSEGLTLAELALDVGMLDDAERLARGGMESSLARGYVLSLADARIVLAQVAAARGEWAKVDEYWRLIEQDGLLEYPYYGQIARLFGLVRDAHEGRTVDAARRARELSDEAEATCDFSLAAAVTQVEAALLSERASSPSECDHWQSAFPEYAWITRAMAHRDRSVASTQE